VLLNEELTPAVGLKLKPGGEVFKMNAIDDYTIRIEFAVAYPTAVLVFTHPWGMGNTPGYLPSHYLREFHPTYNSKAADLAKENGHDEWYQNFRERNSGVRDMSFFPERPTIAAFWLKEIGPDHYLFERNPYYWKVDPAGNQLPYVDRVFTRFVSTVEIQIGMITNGEIDAAFLGQALENYPLFKENEDQGNYVTQAHPMSSGAMAIRINQTVEDGAVRALLEDKRFRIALSLAIDRQEHNELLFFGLGRPGQWTVSPASEYFEPDFAEAYAEYDLDGANALLDEIGLTWDSSHEYRLRPDGEELKLEMLFSADHAGVLGTAELLKEHWRDIGVNLDARSAGRDLMQQRAQANTSELHMWGADGGVMFTTLPQGVVPTSNAPWFAGSPRWALWFSSEGADGIEPPEAAKMVYNNWQKMLLSPDDERIRLGKELLRSQAENLYTIGTVSDLPMLLFIARDNMGNIPGETLLLDQAAGQFGPYHPETFFFKKPLYPNQEY
jgi:peptide/nickel transport system substrate-binding protein